MKHSPAVIGIAQGNNIVRALIKGYIYYIFYKNFCFFVDPVYELLIQNHIVFVFLNNNSVSALFKKNIFFLLNISDPLDY